MSLAVSDIANKLLMFVFYMAAARYLGVSEYGRLSFGLAFVTMLAVLGDLGLGAVAAREIARDRATARRHVSAGLAIKAVAAVVVIGLTWVLVTALNYEAPTVRLVMICSLFVVESAFTFYFAAVFQGFEKMHLTALTRILQSAVLVAGLLVLRRGAAAAERYALLYVAAGLASASFAALVTNRSLVRLGFSFRTRDWVAMLKPAAPIGMAAALVVLYYWNGTAMLSSISGDAAVGAYAAAFRLTNALAFLGLAFSGALYPLLSQLHVTRPDSVRSVLDLAFRYVVTLMLPVGLFVTFFAGGITSLLYGAAYGESANVLRVLVWWSTFACVSSLMSNYMMAVDRARVVLEQAAISLGISVAANLVLIPRLGALGAGVAMLAAEAVGTIYLVFRQQRDPAGLRLRSCALITLRVVAAAVPATFAAALCSRWCPLLRLLPAAVVYCGILVLLRGFSSQDIGLLQHILRRGED